jgi:hypothetical protein
MACNFDFRFGLASTLFDFGTALTANHDLVMKRTPRRRSKLRFSPVSGD